MSSGASEGASERTNERKDAGELPGFRRTANSFQLLDTFHLQQSFFFDAKSEDKEKTMDGTIRTETKEKVICMHI